MRILVTVDGGLVQSVSVDAPPEVAENMEVVVIDYDIDGVESDKIHEIPQSENPVDTADAFIGWHGTIGITNPNITAYLDKIP